MPLKIVRTTKDLEGFDERHEKVKVIIEVGEVELAEPSFRKKARIIAYCDGDVHFALQYQHDGEPGVWISDPSFPWHGRNFDSIIRAAARYHEAHREGFERERNEVYDHHKRAG